MSRLYSVESTLTSTGSAADHRLRLASSEIPAFAAALAVEVYKQKHLNAPFIGSLKKAAASLDVDARWVFECAEDGSQFGKALVVAGEHLPIEVHAIVIALNQVLQAPVRYVSVPEKASGIEAAVARLNSGSVETLFTLEEIRSLMPPPI